MASQPTIVTGRRRQRELLWSWSGWPLTSILIDPAEVAHAREAGWSGTHHHEPETGERIVGTAEGLGFGVDDGWHNPLEVIPWTEVEAIARAVPDDVRQQLVEFRSRWRDHQVAYPRFVASTEAVGCGPIVPGQPLTPRQEAHVREHAAFEASGVLPAWDDSGPPSMRSAWACTPGHSPWTPVRRPATSSSCWPTSNSTGMPSSSAPRPRLGRKRRATTRPESPRNVHSSTAARWSTSLWWIPGCLTTRSASTCRSCAKAKLTGSTAPGCRRPGSTAGTGARCS